VGRQQRQVPRPPRRGVLGGRARARRPDGLPLHLAQQLVAVQAHRGGEGADEAADEHRRRQPVEAVRLDGLEGGARDLRHLGDVLDGHAPCRARLSQPGADALHAFTPMSP
jgi:hypothetical protein